MTKKAFIIFVGLAWLLFAASGVFGKEPAGVQLQNQISLHKANQGASVQTLCNIANWAYWLRYDGWSGRDPFTGDSGGFYPRGPVGVIFQDGFIWGGIIRNDTRNPEYPKLRVGGQTYRIGTVPGWIVQAGDATNPPVAVSADDPRVGVYRVRRDYETLQPDQATVIKDAAELNAVSITEVTPEMAQAVIDQYANDWANWPGDLGAPFVDMNGNGQWDPGVDEPGIADADQVIWFVANDMNLGVATNLYGSPSIGLELQVTMWAYNQPGATLGQMMFKRYRIINKSGFRIDSMFVSQWCDPDVGNYTDDLVGSDVPRSLGFAYSGAIADDQFQAVGLPPASVGYDFFQGPVIATGDPADTAIWDMGYRAGYVNMPMTSFGYFAAGSPISDPTLGDYEGTLEWYNLLNGFIPTSDTANPSPFVAGSGPNAGQPTKFPVSGDPFRLIGDLDAFGTNLPPGDRRMSLASGPFTMEPGDTQEVVVAIIGGIVAQEGGTNRNAVEQMKLNDDFSQFIFNKLFSGIPKPPTAPVVNVTPLEDAIVLEWGSDPAAVAETEKDDPILGFNFEGYNVYQFPSKTAPKSQAKRIATFDEENFITIIRAKQFVAEFGDIVEVPIQSGTDNGIQRYFVVNKDYIKDRPLYAGNSYFFAVTAYNFNPDPTVPEPSLESSPTVIEVVPQPPKPGVRYPNAPGDPITVTKTGTSTGSAEAFVVDPAQLTGHNYKIGFHTEAVGGLWHRWYLLDATTGDTLIKNQENLSGDNAYPIVDGVLVKAIGPKEPGLAGWDYDGTRWVSGVNWGGQEFFGGLDIGKNFFGSTLSKTDLVPIHLVFQGDTTSGPADGWASKGAVYWRDQGYIFAGIGYLPFAGYDMSDPDNPRQVNISFVEDVNAGNHNLRWDMGGWDPIAGAYKDPSLGGREYVFIHKSDYSEGAGYDDTNWAPASDVLYAFWPHQRGSHPYLEAAFTMDIFANLPNTPSDFYTYSTNSVTISKRVEKADVEKVNVFPNPYYAFNPEEPSRFERFVTFTHLPKKAEIRIFNLAGVQVRKLEKNDDSQFFRWNLRNEADLPVGSGIYVVRINMPDLGKTKVLKLFIVQAEEILEFF